MSEYEKIGGASPLTSSPRYANPTNRTVAEETIPTTLMAPSPYMKFQNTDRPFVQTSSDPTIVVDKNNPFANMMQAKTDLIAEAIKLLGPNGNENAQSILKGFSYTELVDVVEDLTPKSAN